MNQTSQITKHNNLVGLWKRTTEEMFQITNAKEADVIWNSDIGNIATYGEFGWQDIFKQPIGLPLFVEIFETGDLSKWVIVNDTVNKWVVTNSEHKIGLYSACISNDINNIPSYDKFVNQVSYIYIDIPIPSDKTRAFLSFEYKCVGEQNWDFGNVYIAPTTVTPAPGIELDINYLKTDELSNVADWQKEQIEITEFIGDTARIIFAWKNDNSVGSTPLIIDNVIVEVI